MWEYTGFPAKPGEDGNDVWTHNFIRPANDLVWSEYAVTEAYMAACHNYLAGRRNTSTKEIAHKLGYKEMPDDEDAALSKSGPEGSDSPFDFMNMLGRHEH